MKLYTKNQRIWFTSDLHLFHKNILKFSPKTRDGKDEIEMSSILISNFNRLVKDEDILFILGDVSFGNLNQTSVACKLLNGKKHLILGNHDGIIEKNMPIFSTIFESISSYKEVFINDRRVVLMHYPLESWNAEHYGSIHLHGHTHGRLKTSNRKRLDVGVDARTTKDMLPFLYDSIEHVLLQRKSLTKQEIFE